MNSKNKVQKNIIKIEQKENNSSKKNTISKKNLSSPRNRSTEKSSGNNNKEIKNKNSIKENKKIIKNISQKDPLITEEYLKKMLKGEPHQTKSKKVKFSKNKNSPQKNNITIIKPRELYLKEKINKMKSNYNQDLLNNINKEIFSQVDVIKKELSDNNINITEVPKNLNKLLPKSKLNGKEKSFSFSSTPNLFFPLLNNITNNGNTDEYNTKQTYKNIRNLKEEQNIIKKNLIKISENEKLLENESLLNDSNNNLKLDYNLKMQQLKSMKSQKEKILEKINMLDKKINNLMENETSTKLPKNEILKNFIQNFNRDIEIAEIRSKKYLLESKKRKIRLNNEINSLKEKRIKELDLKEKEAEKQKEEILFKFKEQQKSIQLKQLKNNEKQILKCKPFIREKPEKRINSYLFKIYQNKFLKKEEKLQKNENKKRKEKMKAMNFKELKEFAENFDEQKSKNEEENKLQKIKLEKEWKERKNVLPTYKCQSFELLDNDVKEKAEDIKNKEMKKEKLIKLKKSYSQQVKDQFTPIINKDLYNKRIELIKELERSASEKYKINNSYKNKKKKKIVFKKIDPNKPSKYKWKLKLEEDVFDKMNNSDMDMRYLVRRPKKINILSIYNQKKENEKKNMNNNDIINSKENKKTENEIFNKNLGINKWEKAIENKKRNIYENMSDVKKEVEIISKKALEGEQLLRINGGIKNNIELGQNVTNLLIDSIQAKLSILNKLGK